MKRLTHNLWLLSIVIIALSSFIKSASAQSVIPISGLVANHEGVAAWQADGTGPEPAGMGHIVPGVGIKAVYYITSPDYDNIDTSSSAALFSGMEPLTGFPQFTAALQANGFSISQLKAKVGLLSLGNDIEGQDWMMNGLVETRYYRGGAFLFELNGEKMLGGSTPTLIVTIDYSTLSISSATDFFIPADSSRRSSPAVQAVAAAFLADLGNFSVGIVIPSLRVLVSPPITGKGRSGGFFEFDSGRIELGPPLSVEEASSNYPVQFELMQSYPNPFNPETEIRFQFPKASHVVVKIFNTLGEEIRTLVEAEYAAGYHQIRWDGKDKHGHPVASGVYLYQLNAGNFSQVKKMTLQR